MTPRAPWEPTRVTINGEDYISIRDFAACAGVHYNTIFRRAKYGDPRTGRKFVSILWNGQRLIRYVEYEDYIRKAPGRPRIMKRPS